MRREKQEERENIKEHFSLLRTNKQETHFFRKRTSTNGTKSKTTWFFLKKREYATEEKTKGEKNDDQTEQSPQKKRYMKNGSNRGKTFKNENKKETRSKTNENKSKREKSIKERRTNMQNINMKRCKSKKEIDKQVFLNLWKFHNLVF